MRRREDSGQEPHAARGRADLDDQRQAGETAGTEIVPTAEYRAGNAAAAAANGFAPVSEEFVASLEKSICEEDHDGPQQRAMARNLARREADHQLIETLAWSGFTGPGQRRLEAALGAYGYPVMMAWTRTGEIIAKVAERGRPLGIRDTGPGWSRDDRSELSIETVARSLAFFRSHVLLPGKWDPTRGATIKTYFVGACLFQFPNVYHRWETEQRHWPSNRLISLDDPDDPAGVGHLSGNDDPAHTVLTNSQLDDVLAELAEKDPVLRKVADLRLQGYSDADAAKQVGLSARAVEGRWYRFKKELRQQDDEGSPV